MRRGTRDRILDAGTGVVLLAALALLVEARVLPAWRAREVAEIGAEVPRDLAFRMLATGERLALGRGSPTLMLVFRSDCPACRSSLALWRTMSRHVGPDVRVLAVGLEPAESALPYAREELRDALAVSPRRRERFLRVLAVEAVPATILVDGAGRLRIRRQGLVTADDVEAVRRVAARIRP